MNSIRKYDIPVFTLEDRTYNYQFDGGKAFFDFFQTDITGTFKADVELTKTNIMLLLKFEIEAEIDLECDRTLEAFTESISLKEKYFFRYGEEAKQDYSDDMEIIVFGTQTINIAQHLYDFIALAVPTKRLHPKFRDKIENSDEDTFVYSTETKQETEQQEEEKIDARWAILKQLKK